MRIAVFPGSFDPFTKGHESVVRRALTFMDEVVIGVGVNEGKKTMFSLERRLEMIRTLYRNEPRVRVEAYDTLTVDFAQSVGAEFMVRGIRSVKDFEYEESIADINRQLAGIETILLFTEPELSSVSSSVVRELIGYNKDVSIFLPEGMDINRKE
jgi:pantetheine-phosphate adenylyltransferase